MKNFNQLSKQEREQAQAIALNRLIEHILDGAIRFNDKVNKDNLQANIDAACEKADKMKTPWFTNEYILDTCRADLESMAKCDAENALYPSASENIIRLTQCKKKEIKMNRKITKIYKVPAQGAPCAPCDYCNGKAIIEVKQEDFPNNLCSVHFVILTK